MCATPAFLAESKNVVMELLSEHFCFGGVERFYQHESSTVSGPIRFGVFMPPQASLGKVAGMVFPGGIGESEQTFLATDNAMSRPRSSSIIANARSIQAMTSAEVQIGPSFTKIESGSTRTYG